MPGALGCNGMRPRLQHMAEHTALTARQQRPIHISESNSSRHNKTASPTVHRSAASSRTVGIGAVSARPAAGRPRCSGSRAGCTPRSQLLPDSAPPRLLTTLDGAQPLPRRLKRRLQRQSRLVELNGLIQVALPNAGTKDRGRSTSVSANFRGKETSFQFNRTVIRH